MAKPPPNINNNAIFNTLFGPKIKDDVYKWALYCFPWGEKNTPLERFEAPHQWQKDEMDRMSLHIANNHNLIRKGDTPEIYQSAIVAGRGPGKSALFSMLSLWMMSNVLGSSTVLCANNESQLKTKLFAEINKWRVISLIGHWFEQQSTHLSPATWFAKKFHEIRGINDALWYCDGVLWNADDPSGFAGAHNGYGLMIIFDEASGIPQPIWTVAQGFLTDVSAYRFWLAASNPRNNTGAFFECFNARRDYWYNTKIDSRSVKGADLKYLNSIIDQYGIDSDEARIEVLGEFPRQGDRQFIASNVVAEAVARKFDFQDNRVDDHAALLMGVDPARFGEDTSVIRFRRGRDARSIPPLKFKGMDTMKLANAVADAAERNKVDAIFIDSGGFGAGVIDRLRERGYLVHEVGFGAVAENPDKYADHRTEMWGRMKEWLSGAIIDNDEYLISDLVGPEYEITGRGDSLKLESKEKMKKRGLKSPDNGDALAVTFHCRIARQDDPSSKKNPNRRNRRAKGLDYDPFNT